MHVVLGFGRLLTVWKCCYDSFTDGAGPEGNMKGHQVTHSHIVITRYAAEKAGDTLTPDQAAMVRDWLEFCQDRRYRRIAMLIDFNQCRDRSRWTVERRGRPFTVKFADTLNLATSSKTLEGAIRLAQKWVEAREAVVARQVAA